MTSTSPDLPRPDRRGFSRHSFDVAHTHRDAARTSPQRKTALGARDTCRRRAAWQQRGDIARPWVQRRYVSRPGPRRARHSARPDHEGGQAEDPICPRDDHQRWPEGARRLIELTQERAAVAGVGYRRGVGQRASRGPGPSSRFFKGPGPSIPLPKQPNGAPGKKPAGAIGQAPSRSEGSSEASTD